MSDNLLSTEYTTAFNAITDAVTQLTLIRDSWKAHPFLQKEMDEVIAGLIQAQQKCEEYVVCS